MNKTLRILKNVFTTLIVIIAVSMMIFTIVSVMTFNRTDRKLLGYRAFVVLTDSMSKDNIRAGDLVLVKDVKPEDLKKGDIISFQSTNDDDTRGKIITHKIREVTKDENGTLAFVTYGSTTGTNDPELVRRNFVYGKHAVTLHGVGTFFNFLKSTPGYIICILIPFLLLILIQGFNSIKLFKKYKKEQMDELNAEKEKIETEREESQKMMQEILQLREELNKTKKKASEDKGTEPEEKPEDETTSEPEPESHETESVSEEDAPSV